MAESNRKALLNCDIERVWKTITSLDDYKWRSDIDRIEVVDGDTFVEYDKEGIATTFKITVFEPFNRYEMDIENENMSGHFVGRLVDMKGQTAVDFTEEVNAKKLVMKPFVKMYLKKQQEQYIYDLRKELEMK